MVTCMDLRDVRLHLLDDICGMLLFMVNNCLLDAFVFDLLFRFFIFLLFFMETDSNDFWQISFFIAMRRDYWVLRWISMGILLFFAISPQILLVLSFKVGNSPIIVHLFFQRLDDYIFFLHLLHQILPILDRLISLPLYFFHLLLLRCLSCWVYLPHWLQLFLEHPDLFRFLTAALL